MNAARGRVLIESARQIHDIWIISLEEMRRILGRLMQIISIIVMMTLS